MINRITKQIKPRLKTRTIWNTVKLYERSIHVAVKSSALTSSRSRLRPATQSFLSASFISPVNLRSIFIQTESTPNIDVSVKNKLFCFSGMLIDKGREVFTQPSYIASRPIVALLGVPISKIHFGCSSSVSTCSTTA